MTQFPAQDAQRFATIFEHAKWYKALTLRERVLLYRLSPDLWQVMTEQDRLYAQQHLERWREQVPFSEEEYFSERLRLDGLDEEELMAVFAAPEVVFRQGGRFLPEWLVELQHIIITPVYFQFSLDTFFSFENHKQREDKTFPQNSFLKVLTPFIARATERLQDGIQDLIATSPCQPFEVDHVKKMLVANLAWQLLPLVSRPLTLELHVARIKDKLLGETSEERFQSFIDYLNNWENLLPILSEYAPLTRLLMTTIENWLQTSLEFLHHLCFDWAEICQLMQPTDDPGMLVEIKSGMGDQHKQGRSTVQLRFSSGFRLLYKPKSLAIDMHFQQLLSWLNKLGDHPPFRTLKLINKDIYGWSEFVTSASCTVKEEVERFYQRQGGYLALFYALDGVDLHLENVIAAGEHPLMIDLEALFHPRLSSSLDQSIRNLGVETINRSVMRVGLLPQSVWSSSDHIGIDVSGLTGKERQLFPYPVLRGEGVGTDQMHFIRRHVEMFGQDNLPRLADVVVNVLEYRAQLIAGFTAIYHLLVTYCDEFVAGPLQMFAQDDIRLIVRTTKTYGQLLTESYHPDLLRDALDRDRFFDRLWVQAVHHPQLKRLLQHEQGDLHGGDIPIFGTHPNTCNVYTSRNQNITDFLQEPSLSSVTRKLLDFGEQDLNRQLWFIQASLATMNFDDGHAAWQESSVPLIPSTSGEPLAARLLHAAVAVGDRLCELAHHSTYGATWIGLAYVGNREWRLLPAGTDLYNGASGIALFLAYLGKVTGNAKYISCAQSALTYVRTYTQELQEKKISIGGYEGLGSIIYLYSHLGVLWQDQELLHEATQMTGFLRDLVTHDKALDVISGSAGAIASLLSLYQVMPDPEVLQTTIHCGEHLLAVALQCHDSTPDSASCTERPLTGFSHGAAGMALNLLRLAQVSGEERFRQGAFNAMEYERGVFSIEHQNWPDFRVHASQAEVSMATDLSYVLAWCHGAPGIGLARLASLPYNSDTAIYAEIESALHVTLLYGFDTNHSLCHGGLGNFETVLMATRVLGGEYYQEAFERVAGVLLDSIEQCGWKTGVPLEIETPGLMTGIAGIGYEFLRCAFPDQVPSVLTLEPPL